MGLKFIKTENIDINRRYKCIKGTNFINAGETYILRVKKIDYYSYNNNNRISKIIMYIFDYEKNDERIFFYDDLNEYFIEYKKMLKLKLEKILEEE